MLHREKHGEHTVWVSPNLPPGMGRPGGQWCVGGGSWDGSAAASRSMRRRMAACIASSQRAPPAADAGAGEGAGTREGLHCSVCACRASTHLSSPRRRRSLSDFTLTKQLYKGKASTLYQATDKPSGATVALKSYSKRRLSTLNWYQVEREVRLHSQLRHPNVISLHAAFEDDNYVFMITEFAAGGCRVVWGGRGEARAVGAACGCIWRRAPALS